MPTAQRVLTAVVGQSCTSAILILALSGIFMPNHVRAQSETSFAERYALAEDRDKVLLELIPGTEDYFYYHCLHYQTTGRIAEARGQLDAWIAKFGITANAKRMQTRQMLFEYSNNQQATLDFLIREYGINVYHVPPQKDEAAQLSTKLDSAALNWIEMLRQTAKSNGGVNLLEDAVLSKLLNAIGDSPDIRVWLSRIHRADTPGLVDAIGRELKMKDSQGFGWAPIHHELTLQQMIELRKRIPTLEQSGVFVNDYLRRIRPSDDETIRSNDTKRKHLERLEEFVSTLPEVHNSLIASVLYHRLLLDAESGTMDRKRFVRYLQMPSSRPYLSADYARTLNNKVHVDFNANYENETGQRPIGDDRALTLRYLEHFYTTDADVGEFARYLDRDYLTQVFATTKILYGVGDPKTYYAQLSPEAQKELANRVELKFAVSNPKQFLPSDNVRLEMDIKNVPELLVRVFRLNARNILSRQQSPINSAIDLDGLVANVERRINFAMKSDRRHRATIDLPELQGAGVWVVECLASGQRSRALVHKGHLQSIQRISDAGQILQIVNESGKPVPTAKVLLGEREFGPNELGEILIPFEGETKVKSIVLFDGNFATLEQFTHFAEAYELRSSFLVDPQAILAGTRTIALIRNSLLCSGQPIPLEDLIEPKLQVVTVDLDGVSSTQTYSNLKLSEHADHAQPLIIPPRLASISMTLSGQVQKQFDNTKVPVSSSYQFNVNEMSKTSAVNDFFLTRSAEGYQLELRGRNGEPYGRQPVQLEFKLFGLTSLINMRLATNANGIIDLGHLPWVEYFRSSAAGVAIREFKLA